MSFEKFEKKIGLSASSHPSYNFNYDAVLQTQWYETILQPVIAVCVLTVQIERGIAYAAPLRIKLILLSLKQFLVARIQKIVN